MKTPNGSKRTRRWPRMERRRALVQELEPRILLSADLPALAGASELTSLYAPTALEQLEPASSELTVVENRARARELYFVDAAVADHERIVAELIARSGTDARLDVAVLDAGRDGLEQIGEVLQGYRGELGAVHLITHGSERGLQLGNTWLTAETLAPRAPAVADWSAALTRDADLLLYGCDLAASTQGETLLGALGALTGADVAASADPTGSAPLGGDWELEYRRGAIEADSLRLQSADWNGLLGVIDSQPTENASLEITSTPIGQSFSFGTGPGTYTVNSVSLLITKDAAASGQQVTLQIRSGSWNGPVVGGFEQKGSNGIPIGSS